jgi:hypothetical protein
MILKNRILIGIGIVLIVLSIFLLVIYFIGGGIGINNFLNSIFAGEPDVSCVVDSDCAIKSVDCNPCSCKFEAVNKNWDKFCPVYLGKYYCTPCLKFPTLEAKCIENKCVKVNS